MTFNWKLPDWPPRVIVTSLPITCAQTMHTASGITGFTLPGMMLLPGCRPGSAISPRPASGPLFIQRRSFAIFIRLTATVFNWPLISTAASWVLNPSKKLSLLRKFIRVAADRLAATRGPNSGCALIPVPTAVPPSGRAASLSSVPNTRSRP